jgi:Cu(I)/Ag(I) efflux system protein CusF
MVNISKNPFFKKSNSTLEGKYVMKRITTAPLILSLLMSGIALAQSDSMNMEGMDMKNMDITGKDMAKKTPETANKAVGVVKAVDQANGTVTFAHGPVTSLGWPDMTMIFTVEDKVLFDNLTVGKKVQFEFVKRGNKYVVTSVK